MASRTRHRITKIISVGAKRARPISHVDKLAFIRKHGNHVDPTNTRQVTRKYNELKRVPWNLEKKATARQRRELKERGFRITDKGVIVDGPRDVRRKPIKGAKLEILRDGVVKWQVKQRRDYVIGLTKKEKREFANDPKTFMDRKVKELREKYPTLKRIPPSKIQKRLQWGSYQGTKDFAPSEWNRGTTLKRIVDELVKNKKSARGASDKLTGIHLVVHIPRKRKKRKGKRK